MSDPTSLENEVAQLVQSVDALTDAISIKRSQLDAAVAGAEDAVALTADNVAAAAEQVTLAADQVALAAGQVTLAENQVVFAAGQVTLAANQAAIATTQVTLAAGHVATSQNNALAAASAAASIQDTAARVGAMLRTRGITNIKAIAFKGPEGWELQGNQSYKTEARPTGRFLGDYANATAAWAANYQGVATVAGDYFWNFTSRVMQECTTLNTATTVRRAGSGAIPAEAVFVVHDSQSNGRLKIFDLTDPLMPMWMDFVISNGQVSAISGANTASDWREATVAYSSGSLYFGASGAAAGSGLAVIDFKTGDVSLYRAAGLIFYKDGILHRNNLSSRGKTISTAAGFSLPVGSVGGQYVLKIVPDGEYVGLVSGGVSAGGLSVLKPDGSLNWSASSNVFSDGCTLNQDFYAINTTLLPNRFYSYGRLATLQSSFGPVNTWTNATVPALSSHSITNSCACDNSILVRSGVSLDELWPNPTTLSDSLIARRGLFYATPPMKKAEAMLICSTVEGFISDSDRYESNFSAGVDGWTPVSNVFVSHDAVNERLVINRDESLGVSSGIARSPNILEVGKFYFIRLVIHSSPGSMRFDLSSCRKLHQSNNEYYSGSGTRTWLIQATQTYFEIRLTNTYGNCNFSSIKAIGVVPNFCDGSRSATLSNAPIHAAINGTLTATAEVAGGVAGLSGFTTGNYLEVPYLSALDVGTGDFYIPFAFKTAGSAAIEVLIARAISSGGNRVVLLKQADNTIACFVNGSLVVASASSYADSLVHTGILYREAGVIRLEIDGRQVASAANTTSLTEANAVLRVGRHPNGNEPATSCTIWFAGMAATFPSATERSLMHTHMRNLILNKASLDEIPSALAYDPIRGAVEMVGATKRQTMRDGAITASVDHGQGTTPAVAVGPRSEIGIGGTTGVSVSVPERNLRAKTLTLVKERFTVTYAGNATRTLFPDPAVSTEMSVALDARPVRVSNAGVVQTEGAAEDYVVRDYGLGRYVAAFAVAPGSGNDVIVEFEREVYK